LEADSFVRDERTDKDKKRKYMFSVGTSRRVFFMHSETEAEMNQWIHAIKNNIEKDVGDTPQPPKEPLPTPQPDIGGFRPPPVGATDAPPRARLAAAKNCIPYLLEVCTRAA
jgi:hypothetical protein